jgi:hypothetical protein
MVRLIPGLLMGISSAGWPQNCPIAGKNLPKSGSDRTLGVVPVDVALVNHLVAGTGLTAAEAQRVVEDVLAFYAEPLEEYVRRRHAELKTFGAKNDEIFARIAAELGERVVAAPPLSERQLRRIIYT